MKRFIRRVKRRLKYKYVIERYKEAISEGNTQYPFLRWVIADARCGEVVNAEGLIKWQAIRDRYFKIIIQLRPRDNEFFSY